MESQSIVIEAGRPTNLSEVATGTASDHPAGEGSADEKTDSITILEIPPALHTLAWSAAVAVLIGLATFMGVIYTRGSYAALGISALSVSTIDQNQLYTGFEVVLQVVIYVALILVLARWLNFVVLWVGRKTPRAVRDFVSKYVWRHKQRLALILLFATVVALNIGIHHLADQAKDMLFKGTADIGDIWTSVIFEDDADTANSYNILFALGVATAVFLGWWLVKYRFFKTAWSRRAFTLLLACYLGLLFLGYSYLNGVAATVHDYPVVVWSGMSPSDQGYVAFLLGQDDKMFAVLLLRLKDDKPGIQTRTVLYLPRTEVKWMATIAFAPLYRFEKMDDLKRLAEQAQSAAR